MENIGFENFIGKHVSVANFELKGDFENKIFGSNLYYTPDGSYKYFHNMPYKSLTIITDEKDFVQEITIHFDQIINESFFDSFIISYGEPYTVQVVDKVSIVSKSKHEDGDFKQNLRKGFVETKEGKFEDDPLFMIWKKKDYDIKTLTRREQNRSELTFRLPTNKF